MAKHVNTPSNLRRIIVKKNFEALYAAKQAEETYTTQDIQHLQLINPNAVLPSSYSSIPRIPPAPRISRPSAPAPKSTDQFENEYEAFVRNLKVKKATTYCNEHDIQGGMRDKIISLQMPIEEYEKLCQQVTVVTEEPVDDVKTEITETVKETTNESVEESTPVETNETLTIAEPVKKTRKSKKKVVEQANEVVEKEELPVFELN